MSSGAGRGLDRRSFLKYAVLAGAGPAVFARRSLAEYDVVIVGAGAAGLSAARRLRELGRSFLVVEATARIGGRAHTNHSIFGVPYDMGAHWLHNGDRNPFRDYAIGRGYTVYPASNGGSSIFGEDGPAGPLELAQLTASLGQAYGAILQAGAQGLDVSAEEVVPEVNSWDTTVETIVGASAGVNYKQLSTLDWFSAAGGEDWFCAEGYGTVLADFGSRVPVELSTPVERIDWSGGDVRLETTNGTVTGTTAIITASIGLLNSGRLAFSPTLPIEVLDALDGLRMTRYDHIALGFSENVFDVGADHYILAKTDTLASVSTLANLSGTLLTYNEVSGAFAAELESQPSEVAVDFAVGQLAALYGSSVEKKLVASDATRWGQQEWTLGSWAAAIPGRAADRRRLRQLSAIGDRIFLAGEAMHPDLMATVAGAALSGRHVAEQVDRVLRGGEFTPLEPGAGRHEPRVVWRGAPLAESASFAV